MNGMMIHRISRVTATLLTLWMAVPAFAQTASVCARVKIEILQELTFERVAFDARLAVTNNLISEPLTNFMVTLDITTVDGQPANDKFFINVSELQNLTGVDGSGNLPSGAQGIARWLIVPSAGAGGTDPLGQTYLVGGSVDFQIAGGQRSLQLFPAPIRVRPQPLLQVDYFLPTVVQADDPFTPPVEPPVPFTLGARVFNSGYSDARNLQITSGQPKIVENLQGLLIAFRLLGTSVNGSPVSPTLNATFGTIEPGECGVAAWQMITTLSGEFVEFSASYKHAPELGGELTSLIEGTSANRLVREMLVDLPGRDAVKDFLADVDNDAMFIPDTIYESDCNTLPVNPVSGSTTGTPGVVGPDVQLNTSLFAAWVFTRVEDPAEGLIPLVGVSRSDGKQLRPENFWVSRVQDEDIKELFHFFVNVVDYETTGSYVLRYQDLGPDSMPPVSRVIFQAPVYGSDPTYVTPLSQILFTATDDISGVAGIERSLGGAPFEPAFPFEITAPGAHVLAFRASDRAGNQEPNNSINVFVDPNPPLIDPLIPTPASFTPSAPEGVAASRVTTLALTANDAIADLVGQLDVASGSGPDFNVLPLVRTIPFTLRSDITTPLVWDGRNGSGVTVPEGTYSMRVQVTDPLGNAGGAITTVAVTEYFNQQETAAAANADQQFPDLRGTTLVWQDNRNAHWDIFLADLGGGPATNLTAGQIADQIRPATDGAHVVWQDRRNGNWDIFLYDIATQVTTPFAIEIADQENPVVSAPWVVWQEKRGSAYEIVARNIDTLETVEVSAGDPGTHDHVRPAIDGTTIVFEDYRFGLAEIFSYDLIARAEQRITDNIYSQTRPTLSGAVVVWVDQRDGNRELYSGDLGGTIETRLTYTGTDEDQPYLRGEHLSYVDFAAGLSDPAVSVLHMPTRRSARITSDPNRQEQPTTDGNTVVWQDNRTGRWQIRSTDVDFATLGINRDLGPGLNLVGISNEQAASTPSAFALLAAWNLSAGVIDIQKFDPATGQLLSAQNVDFAVVEGDALIAVTLASASLGLEGPSSCAPLAIAPGANYVSLSCVPPGFTARHLIQALGLSKLTSIARYDSVTGRFRTLVVDGSELVGEDFPIVAGEGYLIYAREAAGPL